MSFVIRRKDKPAYEGARAFWITIAHRNTKPEAEQAVKQFKKKSASQERLSG